MFYNLFSWWDNMLHFVFGFISGCLGLSLFYYFLDGKFMNFSKVFCLIFIVCFSVFISVVWEFFEFGMDKYFYTDMQKDTFVNRINTVSIEGEGNDVVSSVKDILYVDIYTLKGTFRLNGYLDIGLIDTFVDSFFNIVGVLFFSGCYFIFGDRFVNLFLIIKV